MARVAFLGLGVMGAPMAGHLAAKGHQVTVWNRSPAKAEAWAQQHGGAFKATPREAAAGADIVFCCVGNDDDLRSVVLGEHGALATMQQQLTHIVVDIRAGGESVASASSQIFTGNSDLASRTEQQASALQQTAAAMEQLNATVQHNADNSRQAEQLATSASSVAVRGGDMMGQVVSTMQDIQA